MIKTIQALSVGEETLKRHLDAYNVPMYRREYQFKTDRRWRFDFAWPEFRLAVEVEGGTRTQGRHNRHEGFSRDCDKYNAAARDGWIVLRYTTDAVKSAKAIDEITDVIQERIQRNLELEDIRREMVELVNENGWAQK